MNTSSWGVLFTQWILRWPDIQCRDSWPFLPLPAALAFSEDSTSLTPISHLHNFVDGLLLTVFDRGGKEYPNPPGILHYPETIYFDLSWHNLGNYTVHTLAISKTISTGSRHCDLPSSQPLGRSHCLLYSLLQGPIPLHETSSAISFFFLKSLQDTILSFFFFFLGQSVFWSIWSPGVLPKHLVNKLSVSCWEYYKFSIPWHFSALTRYTFKMSVDFFFLCTAGRCELWVGFSSLISVG